jgi:hypothetical protein
MIGFTFFDLPAPATRRVAGHENDAATSPAVWSEVRLFEREFLEARPP